MADYTSESQQRILRALTVLAGNEFNGLTPSEVAKAVRTSASNATRDLANLREAGLAEVIQETGRWRLGPKLVQIAVAFSTHLNRAQTRLDELTNRYTRSPS